MELPGTQQVPQQQPQQAPQQAKSNKPFPANKEEALKFSNDILQILVDEKIYANTVKQLESIKDVDKGQGVGMIAGQIVGNRVADVRGQTKRKLKMGLVVGAVQATIKGIASIAKENQVFEMKKEQYKVALKTAIGMLDNAGAKQQAQPQQTPQQTPQQAPQQPQQQQPMQMQGVPQ